MTKEIFFEKSQYLLVCKKLFSLNFFNLLEASMIFFKIYFLVTFVALLRRKNKV